MSACQAVWRSTIRLVLRVGIAGAGAGAALDDDLPAALHPPADHGRGRRDPALVGSSLVDDA
jgi:hypothetical protein